MKALASILVAVLILLVGLNAWQYTDRQRLRENINQSATQLQVKVEATAAPLRGEAASLAAEKQALTRKLALLEDTADAEAEKLSGAGKNPMKALSVAMENPGMLEMMAAQQKSKLDAQYVRLYENLSLEGEELEHFQKLITDAQMVIMKNGLKMVSGDVSPEQRQELIENITSSQEELKERVKEFLNDDADYEYYTFYTDTLGERTAMNGLRGTLEGIGEPLDYDTEEALVRLMHDERQAIGFEDNYYDQNHFDPSTMTQAKIDQFMGQYDELQSNLADRAGSLLSGGQLEAFQSNQKASRSMQEMGLGMMLRMFGNERP